MRVSLYKNLLGMFVFEIKKNKTKTTTKKTPNTSAPQTTTSQKIVTWLQALTSSFHIELIG